MNGKNCVYMKFMEDFTAARRFSDFGRHSLGAAVLPAYRPGRKETLETGRGADPGPRPAGRPRRWLMAIERIYTSGFKELVNRLL